MSGPDGVGVCSYDELRDYLMQRGEEYLLEYVHEQGGRYELVRKEFEKIKLPSVQYQVAVVFALLGEYSIAERLHSVKWSDLSSWGDKVGNNLLKRFMRPFPART